MRDLIFALSRRRRRRCALCAATAVTATIIVTAALLLVLDDFAAAAAAGDASAAQASATSRVSSYIGQRLRRRTVGKGSQISISLERVKPPEEDAYGKSRKKFPITWLRNQYPFSSYYSKKHVAAPKHKPSSYAVETLDGQYSQQNAEFLDPNPSTWVRIPNRPTASFKIEKQSGGALMAPPLPAALMQSQPPPSLQFSPPVELSPLPPPQIEQMLMAPTGNAMMLAESARATNNMYAAQRGAPPQATGMLAQSSAAQASYAPQGEQQQQQQQGGFGGISLSFGNGRSISFGGGQGLTIGGRAGAISIGGKGGGGGSDEQTAASSGYAAGAKGGYEAQQQQQQQTSGGGYASGGGSSYGYGNNHYVSKHPTMSVDVPRKGKTIMHANLDMAPVKVRLHSSPRVKITTGSRDPLEKPGDEELTESEEDIFEPPEPFPKRNATAANETSSDMNNTMSGNNTMNMTDVNGVQPMQLPPPGQNDFYYPQRQQPGYYQQQQHGYGYQQQHQYGQQAPIFDDAPTSPHHYQPHPQQQQQQQHHTGGGYGPPPPQPNGYYGQQQYQQFAPSDGAQPLPPPPAPIPVPAPPMPMPMQEQPPAPMPVPVDMPMQPMQPQMQPMQPMQPMMPQGDAQKPGDDERPGVNLWRAARQQMNRPNVPPQQELGDDQQHKFYHGSNSIDAQQAAASNQIGAGGPVNEPANAKDAVAAAASNVMVVGTYATKMDEASPSGQYIVPPQHPQFKPSTVYHMTNSETNVAPIRYQAPAGISPPLNQPQMQKASVPVNQPQKQAQLHSIKSSSEARPQQQQQQPQVAQESRYSQSYSSHQQNGGYHHQQQQQHHNYEDQHSRTYTFGNGGITTQYGGGGGGGGGHGHGHGHGGTVPSDGFDQKNYAAKVEKFEPEAHDKRERSKVILFLKPRISIHMANSSTTTPRPKNPQRFVHVINRPIFLNSTNATHHDEEFIDPDLREPMDVAYGHNYGYGYGYGGKQGTSSSTTKKPKKRTTTTTTTTTAAPESETTTTSPETTTTSTEAPSSSTESDSSSSSSTTSEGDSSSTTTTTEGSTTSAGDSSTTPETTTTTTTTSTTAAPSEIEMESSTAASSTTTSTTTTTTTTELSTTPAEASSSEASVVADESGEQSEASSSAAPASSTMPDDLEGADLIMSATESTRTTSTTMPSTTSTTSTTTTTARTPIKTRPSLRPSLRRPVSTLAPRTVPRTSSTTTTTTSTTTTTTTTTTPEPTTTTEAATEPTTSAAPVTEEPTSTASIASMINELTTLAEVATTTTSTTTQQPLDESSTTTTTTTTAQTPTEESGSTQEAELASSSEEPTSSEDTSAAEPLEAESMNKKRSASAATQAAAHQPMLLSPELIDKLMANRTLVNLMSSQLKRVLDTEQMQDAEKQRIVRQVFEQMMDEKVDFSMNNVRLAVKTVSHSYRTAAQKQRAALQQQQQQLASNNKRAARKEPSKHTQISSSFGARTSGERSSKSFPAIDTALKLTSKSGSLKQGGGGGADAESSLQASAGSKVDSSGNPIVVVLLPQDNA